MKLHKHFLYLLLLIAALSSCNDNDEDEGGFGIRITPIPDYIDADPGDVVSFIVSVESDENLARYRVSESIDGKASRTIREENISGRFYTDFYDYTVPDTFSFGSHEIQLIFSTVDARGQVMRRAKIIDVVVSDRLLTEYAGNSMYSSLSGQFDAFNLLTGTPIYSSDTLAHLRDLTGIVNQGDSALSKAWTSPVPEIKYVRFNNFDYGNATEEMVRTAYNSGVKNDTLRNLQENDIILSKINDRYLALKLIFVIDQAGTVNDRYLFNIKR
jgi:hypothetical protein